MLLAALAAACAPALRAPRPPERPAPPGAEGRTARELVAGGWASFGRRPDPGWVRRAQALFLAAAGADRADVEALYGAVQAEVWRIERDPGADRAALADSAVDAGQECLRRAPADARCDYALALALGMEARERRATALDALRRMVEHLRRAAARDPALDGAGPDRVLAEVLARAPGWPLGPGDPEGAVVAARRADARAPAHPPNALALSQALLAAGDREGARAAAARAVALATASADPDAPEWLRDAEALAREAAR